MRSADLPVSTSEHRERLRRRRDALSSRFVTQASRRICQRIARLPLLLSGQRFALYRAIGNEVDLSILEARLSSRGLTCLLPVLRPNGFSTGLFFQRYRPGDRLCRNRYGIIEPCFDPARCVAPRFLSVVFLPLLGFGAEGGRLGMGGGFYDRALGFRFGSSATRPVLVGVAYDCQYVGGLQQNPWDVPLDAVVTESGVVVWASWLAYWFDG